MVEDLRILAFENPARRCEKFRFNVTEGPRFLYEDLLFFRPVLYSVVSVILFR